MSFLRRSDSFDEFLKECLNPSGSSTGREGNVSDSGGFKSVSDLQSLFDFDP